MNVARLVVPALRWRDDTGFAHERARIEEALALGVGGFILFGGTATAVRDLTAELLLRTRHPILVAADLERGAGQQFEGLTQVPPPRALASLERDDVIAWAGALTAREARSVGVNWVFAPVADLDVLPDNPIVQTRAFGDDPQAVGRAVATWVRACQAAGALACAKHFPGHGRTAVDSHIAMPSVDASAGRLDAEDLVPFRAAVDAGVASLMTAHVAYPALDPSGLPATLSASILAGLRASGFDGIVVTDALIMAGALAGRSEAEAAVLALGAGVDVLLYPERPAEVVATVERAVADGTLPAARITQSLARVERALGLVRGDGDAPSGPAFGGADGVADLLLERPLARGARPALAGPLELVLVDDDVGGPYPATPATTVAGTLASLGVPLGRGGSRVVLAFAEPRAWKGR
ncbi:MAG TPA: glycoside hydrolase family 3 N-terminal domain-containing protein, partial [Gemmatimonadales bacterium]|nr:glycoside hydrolase family 3 N-terminal domain-containing protein [Gemmatimonadales bacterium]